MAPRAKRLVVRLMMIPVSRALTARGLVEVDRDYDRCDRLIWATVCFEDSAFALRIGCVNLARTFGTMSFDEDIFYRV